MESKVVSIYIGKLYDSIAVNITFSYDEAAVPASIIEEVVEQANKLLTEKVAMHFNTIKTV